MFNYMGQSYKNHAEMMEDIKAGHIRHIPYELTENREKEMLKEKL